MRKIIASIDIDSDYVKLVVGEIYNGRLNILNASKKVVKIGDNVRPKIAIVDAIKTLVNDASNNLGFYIDKVILGIDSKNLKLVKSGMAIKINHEDNNVITGSDVDRILEASSEGKIPDSYALVGVIPVEFTIDGDVVVADPKGVSSENLGLKAIIAMAPKDYVSGMLSIASAAGLRVVDVIPNALGDYMCFKNRTTEKTVGAIINLGYDVSSVSIYNKGILTNTKCYNAGYKNIIDDISFTYKLDDNTSSAIYKDLVLASTRLANPKEYRVVANVDGKNVKITQPEVSELAFSRIEELLEVFKKQINILTKKQISYIIVTGGLTELRDFGLALESSYKKNSYIGNIKLIGARDNSLVSAIGIIEYFDKKLKLRDKYFSLITDNEINRINTGKDVSENKDSLFSKVFGYFFDS